jgi:branched-subunit amino acid transport protein AzlD
MINNESGNDKIDVNLNANSVGLTQYSSEASQLIKSFTKNIPFIVLILILIISMTSFDLIMDLGFTRILSDETIDAMIIAVSLFLILFTFFTVRPVLRSQKILDKWSNLFENNAIKIGILLTINDKSKEEILHALSEIIEQIAIPLQHYISKSDAKEFYNVSVGDSTFDILIDKSTIKPIDSDSLKNSIQDYGSIIVKIAENTIDKNITQSFLESLHKYKKHGSKIGLAMIIGESITQESSNLVNKIKDKTISENLILIEKPNNKDYDLKSFNNVIA